MDIKIKEAYRTPKRKEYGGAIGHTGYYQEWGDGLKAADVYLIDLEARRT